MYVERIATNGNDKCTVVFDVNGRKVIAEVDDLEDANILKLELEKLQVK